jgi:glycosyltransferase A (GT-A) superfamily protein (DUF2064 family)
MTATDEFAPTLLTLRGAGLRVRRLIALSDVDTMTDALRVARTAVTALKLVAAAR